MNIKRVLSFVLLFSLLAFGQADRRDQIKALKSSHLAAALNLSSAQAQKFWPMYLNCDEKIYDIRHNKIRPITNKLEETNVDALSQQDALTYVVKLEAAEEEIFNLRKKLINDLKPVIGPRKILKLKTAEDDFNKLLLSKYKGKKD